MGEKRMILILLGAPGAGKGTQAEMMKNYYALNHLSTGDLLRAALKEGSELGKLAKTYMDGGRLVPDDVILGIIRDYLAAHPDEGILFDGFPRTVVQAQGLADLLTDKEPTAVVLVVPDKAVIERLSSRRTCRECGRVYNPALGIVPALENKCGCGGEIYQRDDDRAETIANRLHVYHTQTESIIEFYREKGLLVEVDGTGKPDIIFNRIKTALS